MKVVKALALTALSIVSLDAAAQSGGGYYQPLLYRSNDPFVFCTQGQDKRKSSSPCWKPVSPYTGQFMLMAYCWIPNPYGKSWTNDDIVSFAQYLSTCPQAKKSGSWKGNGRPEVTPTVH